MDVHLSKLMDPFLRWARISLVLVLVCSACSNSRDKDKQSGQLTSYTSLRDEVVKRVQNGQLSPDGTGVIILPEQLNAASNDAQVYLSKRPNAGLLIAFNVSINAYRREYLLYAERDLPERTKNVKVGPLELNLVGKTQSNWYRAIAL